jgi:hypothetical protein
MRSLTRAHSPTLFRIKPPTKIKENPHRRRTLGSPSERPHRRTEPQPILPKLAVYARPTSCIETEIGAVRPRSNALPIPRSVVTRGHEQRRRG